MKKEKPLYRKLGKSPHYCEEVRAQASYKHYRHSKKYKEEISLEDKHQGMKPKKTHYMNNEWSYHGYDYTPAVKYLYGCIGMKWKRIWNDIQDRLPKNVNLKNDLGIFDYNDPELLGPGDLSKQRLGMTSYWKTFVVTDNGDLEFINPEYGLEDIKKDLKYHLEYKALTYTWEGMVIKED